MTAAAQRCMQEHCLARKLRAIVPNHCADRLIVFAAQSGHFTRVDHGYVVCPSTGESGQALSHFAVGIDDQLAVANLPAVAKRAVEDGAAPALTKARDIGHFVIHPRGQD